MKWQIESYHDRNRRERKSLMTWHKWFAWYPVTNAEYNTRMWLEVVERRLLYTYGWDAQHNVWEYREYRRIE